MGKLDSKNRHLFQFYIPQTKQITMKEAIVREDIYGIVSNKQLIRLDDSIRDKFIILKEYKNINFVKVN